MPVQNNSFFLLDENKSFSKSVFFMINKALVNFDNSRSTEIYQVFIFKFYNNKKSLRQKCFATPIKKEYNTGYICETNLHHKLSLCSIQTETGVKKSWN